MDLEVPRSIRGGGTTHVTVFVASTGRSRRSSSRFVPSVAWRARLVVSIVCGSLPRPSVGGDEKGGTAPGAGRISFRVPQGSDARRPFERTRKGLAALGRAAHNEDAARLSLRLQLRFSSVSKRNEGRQLRQFVQCSSRPTRI